MEFFSNWNFYGLCAFILVCIGALVWQRMYCARLAKESIARVRRQDALDAKAIERRERLEALDAYNEACNMEPLCGEGKVGSINPAIAVALVGARLQQATNAYQSESYKRRLNASIQNQKKAERPSEPPKTAQQEAFNDMMIYGTGIMQTSSSGETRHVPQAEWKGAGGSFDGGGASGDWSSSSSSSSDSGSSDSGSSSGSSSD